MRSKEQEGGFWVCDMESGWYWNDEEPSISQLGKGKAMGKGMYGKGMYQPGKGGKGEGKAAAWDGGKGYGKMGSKGGACWNCGEHGHQARNCPKAAGKGGGGGAGGAPTGIFRDTATFVVGMDIPQNGAQRVREKEKVRSTTLGMRRQQE